MNIAFFLIPKEEVVYIYSDSTMRQALEKMEHHRYTAIPVIDHEGKYIGSLTEGDLLWRLKNTSDLTFENTQTVRVNDILRHRESREINISSQIEDLILKVIEQNFVPVVDDNKIFIGIIRRREIIEYCSKFISAINREL